jgi:predicted DNA-binding protein (UPF0251 family)
MIVFDTKTIVDKLEERDIRCEDITFGKLKALIVMTLDEDEFETIRLISLGLSFRKIAEQMEMSTQNVSVTASKCFLKINYAIKHYRLILEWITDNSSRIISGDLYDEDYSISVDDAELSVRTWNCLKNSNVTDLNQLVYWRKKDLLNIKNMGRKSVNEIIEVVSEFGIMLREEKLHRHEKLTRVRGRTIMVMQD